jgi:putative ABC transport system permease protein
VVYRDPLTSNARLTAGTYATSRVPAGAVGVAATTQMAYRFGLRPGTRLTLDTSTGTVRLYVTGIVAERAPASTFWTQDATVGTPSLSSPAHPYWVIGVIADPDQLVAMEYALSGPGLEMYGDFPLATGGVNADAAQGFYGALNRTTTAVPTLTGALQPAADKLTVTSPLIADLSPFLGTQAGVETVLLLLFISLIVTGATVILIATRTMVARREAELAMLRAGGRIAGPGGRAGRAAADRRLAAPQALALRGSVNIASRGRRVRNYPHIRGAEGGRDGPRCAGCDRARD